MRQERTHNALNGKSVQLVYKVRCIALQWINLYRLDSAIGFPDTYNVRQ